MARNRNANFAKGHNKANPLDITVPAPSGGKFIPESERGPRPELPHNEYSAYEEAATDLTPQQKLENNHIKVQQKNWDAHKELEDNAALEKAKAQKETGSSFGEIDESQLSEDEKRILGGGIAPAAAGERLSSIHNALSGVAKNLEWHAQKSSEVISKVREASTNALNTMNELSLKHATQLAKGKPVDPDEVDHIENLRSFVSNSTHFPQTHIRHMNAVTTANTYLDKAQSLIRAGQTADATDLMVRAHKELKRTVKHVNSPTTKTAYENAGVPHFAVDDLALGGASANLQQVISPSEEGTAPGTGRKRGPQTEAPVIKIGKAGRLKGDPGSVEHITADEKGVAYVQKKYGTAHPYTQRVRRAHVQWKRGRPSNKPISQIMAEPVVSKEEQEQQRAAQAEKEQKIAETPEQRKMREDEFKMHAVRVQGALKAGKPIPQDSADHIGSENVQKLITRHLSEKGEI